MTKSQTWTGPGTGPPSSHWEEVLPPVGGGLLGLAVHAAIEYAIDSEPVEPAEPTEPVEPAEPEPTLTRGQIALVIALITVVAVLGLLGLVFLP